MKEKLKAFVSEKRAVSPVIGVVLMVAVVVILAAVIAAFVLGLGGSQQTTPQATFSYEPASGGTGGGVLVHEGGDTIEAANLLMSVDGKAPKAVTVTGGGTEISAGGEITVGTAPAESIRLIYDDGSGGGTVIWETTV